MKKIITIGLLILSNNSSIKSMEKDKTAKKCLREGLAFFNLMPPPKKVQKTLMAKQQEFVQYENESQCTQALTRRSKSGGPALCNNDKTREEIMAEMNDVGYQQSKMLMRQATLRRYKNLGISVSAIIIGGLHMGYKAWYTGSEKVKTRQIISATSDFWTDIALLFGGITGVIAFFVNSEIKTLRQQNREGDAKSDLLNLQMKNQEMLIQALNNLKKQEISGVTLDDLEATERMSPARSTMISMQKLSDRSIPRNPLPPKDQDEMERGRLSGTGSGKRSRSNSPSSPIAIPMAAIVAATTASPKLKSSFNSSAATISSDGSQ